MAVPRSPCAIDVEAERSNLIRWLREQPSEDELFTVGLSGGVDSDVVFRLALHAVGPEKLRPFLVLQDGQDPGHVASARSLAAAFHVRLLEIDLRELSQTFLERLVAGAPDIGFCADDWLDHGRVKNSLRTSVASMLVERGCVVLGTANRTEIETGFFLAFGDGLAHLQPIAHLFKTQVYELARHLGTDSDVLQRSPSAGYWAGEKDLEDLAYWILLGRPAASSRDALHVPVDRVQAVHHALSFTSLDQALALFVDGASDDDVGQHTGWTAEIVHGLRALTQFARRGRQRSYNLGLTRGTSS